MALEISGAFSLEKTIGADRVAIRSETARERGNYWPCPFVNSPFKSLKGSFMSSQPNNPRPTVSMDTPLLFRTPFSPRYRVSIEFQGEGQTKQSFKDECDVNRIVARFQATGELPNVNALPPQYLDVTAMDFQEHQNYIAGAMSMFHDLPARIRDRFQNDAGEFLDFCSQEKNRPELAEMGLLRADLPPVVPLSAITPAEPASGPINPPKNDSP